MKMTRCDVCDDRVELGASMVSHMGRHIARIEASAPPWLPPELREQAIGEWTFMCSRCNSFPDQKWPDQRSANAALTIHLGAAHGVGDFKGYKGQRQVGGRTVPGMIRVQ